MNHSAHRPPPAVVTHRTPVPVPQPQEETLRATRRGELGQATAEYALVMLAAAALAGLLLAWAAGTDGIGRLFDAVMDALIGQDT